MLCIDYDGRSREKMSNKREKIKCVSVFALNFHFWFDKISNEWALFYVCHHHDMILSLKYLRSQIENKWGNFVYVCHNI